MQPEATMRGLAEVIRRGDAASTLRVNPRAFLQSAGVEGEDLDQMASLGSERLLVYRRLVFNRFREAIELTIPRTVARLGRQNFTDQVVRFLDEQASRSPYMRDIGGEFVTWARRSWSGDPQRPPYLVHLAAHELLGFEMSSVPDQQTPVQDSNLELDRPLRFQRAATVVRYPFAIHRLSDDEDDRTEPEATPTILLAYRDAEHHVRYLELGTTAGEILDQLIRDCRTLRDAIAEGCAKTGVSVDDESLAGIAALLADLAERGVLLGVVPLESDEGGKHS